MTVYAVSLVSVERHESCRQVLRLKTHHPCFVKSHLFFHIFWFEWSCVYGNITVEVVIKKEGEASLREVNICKTEKLVTF